MMMMIITIYRKRLNGKRNQTHIKPCNHPSYIQATRTQTNKADEKNVIFTKIQNKYLS